MNDADLNNNVDSQAQTLDAIRMEKTDQNSVMADQVHLAPSRWWFASAAFPMVAGTLGPVASAFSTCALVKSWRQHILPGSDVTKAVFVPDPPWLVAVNAVQLVIALIANMFLLLNMTKRVRFSVAQPITIVGWYVSAVCLVALCATAGGPLTVQPEIEYVWAQAFYYGIFAAILYFLVASLMVITVWGAEKGHYRKDFELTASQRTLMLQTIIFLMYLLLGALVFSNIEGWNYLDSVYWADVTLFTVGFGDISPKTSLGRALLIPYAFVGIISFGLVIGSIRSLILDRGKRRLDARVLEKRRRQLIRQLRRKGEGDMLEPIQDDTFDYFPENKGSQHPHAEFNRRRKEFALMRKIQDQASRRRRWMAMAASFTTWTVLWLVGAKIFQECEAPYQGWSYFDGVYFCFTALTTIGYGDITPVSNSAKAFFVFWSLLALPTMTVLISNAGDTVVKMIKDGTLRLGNLTILPAEHGFKNETKQILSKLSFGVLFAEDDIEESPPGFLGAAQPHKDEELGDTESGETNNYTNVDSRDSDEKRNPQAQYALKPAGSTKRGRGSSRSEDSPKQGQVKRSPKREASKARANVPTELPKTRSEYHLVLIDEIRRVTKHLQRSPPRKYTFKEWAWYLRLIGEDESNPVTHRKPTKRPVGRNTCAHCLAEQTDQDDDGGGEGGGSGDHHHQHQHHHADNGNGAVPQLMVTHDHDDVGPMPQPAPDDSRNGNDKIKWSWVGHRSPLMDSREEAEWILDKLEHTLREELRAVVRAQKDGPARIRDVEAEERDNEQREGLRPSPLQ
ncbi:hypothetical protein F4809DRAFT_657464 [Biscogniauxia mediterranea]|nr:hypothetical protein F4809DRAFT_657464 [Biscogniauxia mediterranea]